jgi:hypothetical protein
MKTSQRSVKPLLSEFAFRRGRPARNSASLSQSTHYRVSWLYRRLYGTIRDAQSAIPLNTKLVPATGFEPATIGSKVDRNDVCQVPWTTIGVHSEYAAQDRLFTKLRGVSPKFILQAAPIATLSVFAVEVLRRSARPSPGISFPSSVIARRSVQRLSTRLAKRCPTFAGARHGAGQAPADDVCIRSRGVESGV